MDFSEIFERGGLGTKTLGFGSDPRITMREYIVHFFEKIRATQAYTVDLAANTEHWSTYLQ